MDPWPVSSIDMAPARAAVLRQARRFQGSRSSSRARRTADRHWPTSPDGTPTQSSMLLWS